LGIAFGPVILAPLSETFGRLWLYRASFTLLLAFSAGAGGANNFGTLLVCRFLAAFLGSPPLATGAGTIADLWHLGKAGGIAGCTFILGPFLGEVSLRDSSTLRIDGSI
jgi:MFS family permease